MTIEQTLQIINNKDYDLLRNTSELLIKYSWELRFHEENTLLPLKELNRVQQQVQTAFKGDFKWKGKIPYLSYCNMLGLRDYIMGSDDDSVIGIVAPPGTGKSTFTLSCARLIDPTFTNEYTIFTMDELKAFLRKATRIYNQIKEANKESEIEHINPLSGKCVVLDEGVYLLFSGDANSKNGKTVTKLFSIIRALGIIFLVNITNWKRISKGVKEDRFKGLFRLPVKGMIQFFSKARINKIEINKETITWPTPNFYEYSGWIDNSCIFWKEYDQKKSDFLLVATHDID